MLSSLMAPENCWRATRRSWPFGFFMSILGAFLSAVYFFASKHLMLCEKDVHPFWLATLRQSTTLLLSAPQVAYTRAPYFYFSRKIWLYVILRSIFGLGAVVMAQLAIQRISLTDFSTILAITPVVTSVAAWPLLGERLKITDVPAILACVAGVLYIVKPDPRIEYEYESPDLLGCCFAFSVVVLQTGLFIVFRKLKDVPFTSVTFAFALLTTPVMFGLCVVTDTLRWPPCDMTMRLLSVVVGISASVSIIMQIVASQILKAKILSLSHPAELVFQFVLTLVITTPMTPAPSIRQSSITGAALVFSSFVYLASRSLIASIYHKWTTTTTNNDKKSNFIAVVGQ